MRLTWPWQPVRPPLEMSDSDELAEIIQRTQRLERRVAVIEDRIAAIRANRENDREEGKS